MDEKELALMKKIERNTARMAKAMELIASTLRESTGTYRLYSNGPDYRFIRNLPMQD